MSIAICSYHSFEIYSVLKAKHAAEEEKRNLKPQIKQIGFGILNEDMRKDKQRVGGKDGKREKREVVKVSE